MKHALLFLVCYVRQKHCLIKVCSSFPCKRVKFLLFLSGIVLWACYHLCPWNHMEGHILCFHIPLPFFGPRSTIWDSNKTPKKSLHQNLTPQKPHPKFRNHKNFPESIKWLVLNNQKSPFLNQATPKDSCQNFPTQKHPETANFKPRKILQLLLSLEIHSIPPGICFQDKKN